MSKADAAKKNMFCQFSDLHNEAAVESFLITPLVKKLGYKDSQIKLKKDIPTTKIALGSKSVKYRPDYLLSFDGKPRIVIDAKSPHESLTSWIQQISSYAITLNQQFEGENPVRYMVLSNGKNTLVFDWTEGKPLIDAHFLELQLDHPKFKRMQALLAPKATAESVVPAQHMHRFERKSIEDVNAIFARCHQHIYNSDNMSQAAGFTEFVKLVFLKLLSDRRVRDESGDLIWQEHFDVPATEVNFSTRWIKEREIDTPNPVDTIQFQKLIVEIEGEINKGKRKRIFDVDDKLRLNPETIRYVVSKLEGVFLFGIDVDLNGRLFETFLSATMRGKDLGQFFTPRSVVKLGTNLASLRVDKTHIDRVLDGCCGTGGFLIDALADMWTKIDNNSTFSADERKDLRSAVATKALYGVDVGRDPNQARLARMNMYLHGDGGTSIFEADFLDKDLKTDDISEIETKGYVDQLRELLDSAEDGVFDVVLTNPPFAKQYERTNKIQQAVLDRYDIAEGKQKVKSSLLFFERYHDVLKVGGRFVSVIDDGLLSGRDYRGFRDFLRDRFLIRAIVSLPGDAFQRSQARVKTSFVVLEKRKIADGAQVQVQVQEQPPVFMYACRYVGIDDPKRQRVLPIDRKNRDAANKEISDVTALFNAFLEGNAAACAKFVVSADKIAERLDVKSCFAKSGRMISTWAKKGVVTTTIGDLLSEHAFSEEDTVVPEESAEEVTYLVVGYDGTARLGETVMASDYKGSRLFRVKANQIVVSHINAVHGSIGYVSDDLDGCVITSEYTALDSRGVLHPKVICAMLRSPEIRAEFLIKASGVGRTRIDWSAMKDVVVPKPGAALAKDLLKKMEAAEKMKRDAAHLQSEVRFQLEDSFELASDEAVATLQRYKPPK
ncbi:N-6 DNA methylase [Rhodopseudomonas sp. P2A-2r]|uniref:restriction endonuclease subunit M n=1 Tax=Rhodopseudomonas sp. P2A-2r TaxID=2991972 RepID=UPI0022344012|nr:N-6 DNA methylase [Rhodopseudomonas sp. P2A-2r]UZE51146.1 N-6 DNA methylase [Rhodopseudomonas sp. P2A-2r]